MRLIDLSHALNGETPVFPGDAPLELTQRKSLDEDGYTAWSLTAGMHAGTHVDMPAHMLYDTRCASDFPLEAFAGRGVLLDVRGENPIPMRPEYRATVGPGVVVLLYTGFGERFMEEGYFTEYPEVSSELGAFLAEAGVRMVGIDAPSLDYPPFPLHKLLLGKDIPILENLTNLRELLYQPKFHVLAPPIKIQAEAGLTRAVALVE